MQANIEAPMQQLDAPRVTAVLGLYESSWRYLGDRDEADRAYCFRFGVKQAPEPVTVPGGAWAYALPSVEGQQ